jgi:hypothetical protein
MVKTTDKKLRQQIIENLDLSNFTKSKQDKIISGLMANVSSAINIAVLDKLSDQEKLELENISKKGKKTATLQYLEIKITELPLLIEKITRETINEFKKLREYS